jgi:hypothetical protein
MKKIKLKINQFLYKKGQKDFYEGTINKFLFSWSENYFKGYCFIPFEDCV